MDPKNIKPKREWVSVLADRRETKLSSGLFLPEQELGIEKVTEWAGKVIRIGPGDKAPKLGLEEGMKILYRGFVRYANRIETDEVWEDGTSKFYFFIAIEDIIGAVKEGVKVGFFGNGVN